MSPELADTSVYGALLAADPPAAQVIPAAARGDRPHHPAATEEWRTPPLWGLRDSAPYLHDGRAGTLDEAIRLHGGEAEASGRRYRQLSPREQSALQSFLLSLAAPDVPGLR
jgi:cytochrome c peroxidase